MSPKHQYKTYEKIIKGEYLRYYLKKLNVNAKRLLFDTYVGSVTNHGCDVLGITAKDNSLRFNTWCEDNYCFNDDIVLAGQKTTVLE